MNNTDFDRGYVQGFYTALKGTRFIASDPEATTEIVIESIDDTLEQMRADGDLDSINTDVDKLLELAQQARESGVEDQLFAALEARLKAERN